MGDVPGDFVRPVLAGLVPYEPGKPVEEVQRELGLERVVKLASNEGPLGPFPAALEALERASRDLNRYPDGGAYRLRTAIAERHDVRFEEVAVGSGADGVIDGISQAILDPGDGVVCGWPSFPSYVIYATKLGARVERVPLREHRYDLDAILEPVPAHVLTVLDQAYFEYVEDPDYADGIDEYFKAGCRAVVLRTFSKIYGLAGLRVGYGIAPAAVVTALGKSRRAFDIVTPAQEAALASLGAVGEVERRRRLNAEGRESLERILREHGFDPAPGAVANFLYVKVGEVARPLFEELLGLGVIVRPLAGFGAPDAIRVTVGTPDEHDFLSAALGR